MELDSLADQIVDALVQRAQNDPGMSLDDVQRLLVMRVRSEAEQLNVSPRELMGAVWRSWERHSRPAILGQNESHRIVQSLVAKGILTSVEGPEGNPIVRWGGLSRAEVEARLDSLSHEEQLFVRGVLRYLEKYGVTIT